MRIDPVYVIAPKSRESSPPTRRVFLMVGASFAIGTTVGGACGYSMGQQNTAGAQPGPDPAPAGPADPAAPAGAQKEPRLDEPLVKSGDADLDELRRLAVKAPIEELMGNARMFVDVLHDTYPSDEILWLGIGRVCDSLLNGYQVPDRRLFSLVLAQLIEKGDPKVAFKYVDRARELRRIK